MEHRRLIVGTAFILALFVLTTGQAKAGILDFTHGIGGQDPTGNVGHNLNFIPDTDPSLTILANYGFGDNDPLFLNLINGGGASPCDSINCGTIFWGPLDIVGDPTGLGVQDDFNTDTPTSAIDNNEALIFLWQDASVVADSLRLSFYGLAPGSNQVHIAALFFGSDGSNGYDYNSSITISSTTPTSTFDVSTIGALSNRNLGMLVVYANSGAGNLPFGVTSLGVVPEPGSALLLTMGLAAGLFWARKRRQAKP